MAETIHARYCHPSPAPQIDNMYAYGDLFKRCRDLCTDETSFHLALVSLCRRKLAIFTTAGDGEKVLHAYQYKLPIIGVDFPSVVGANASRENNDQSNLVICGIATNWGF